MLVTLCESTRKGGYIACLDATIALKQWQYMLFKRCCKIMLSFYFVFVTVAAIVDVLFVFNAGITGLVYVAMLRTASIHTASTTA